VNRKRVLELSVVFLTVGGVLIAVMQVKSDLVNVMPFLTPSFFKVCLVLGFVLCALGLLLLLLLALPVETAHEVWRWVFGEKKHDPRRAQRDDLEDIHAFGCIEFGEVSPLDKMKDWYKINKDIFHVVYSVRKGRFGKYEKMVGYYSVLPLKAAAVPLLEADNFDGTKITDDLIVREKRGVRQEQPACVYVGSVAARGSSYAKGWVMSGLYNRLILERERGVRRVYSRPVTQKGLELLLRYNFEPVNPSHRGQLKHIYKLSFAAPADEDDEGATD